MGLQCDVIGMNTHTLTDLRPQSQASEYSLIFIQHDKLGEPKRKQEHVVSAALKQEYVSYPG